MKTTIMISACFAFLFASPISAQDRTTINAKSSEISDNLDLRAIASIFGDAKNLEDFERQLNDTKIQISNLDLNDDNQVDYLRVIETVEENTHLIVIQSVLGRDTFQDVATIEVERDHNNQVQVQVVGDVYMYGQNYIYEPVYVTAPIIYSTFWAPRYRPYCSVWYWNYYPTYYYAWNPFPVFRYRHNIGIHINFSNHYNYVNTRRCTRAVVMHQPIRANYCEKKYPTRAFTYRNTTTKNRYELDQTRTIKNVGSRNDLAYNGTRNYGRNNDPIKQNTRNDNSYSNTRSIKNNEPIKQSTTTESNSDLSQTIKSSSNSRTNSGSRNDMQRTTKNTKRYDRSNTDVKSPNSYNESKSRERVTVSTNRIENSNKNSRGNNQSRSERTSTQDKKR